MITYETIRRIEQDEKDYAKLSKLPTNFMLEAMDYLEKKQSIAGEKDKEWELKSADQRIQSISQMREKKIANFALYYIRSGSVPENMMPEEQELFDSIVRSLQEFESKRKRAMSGQKTPMTAIAFLQDVPQFVGIDMGHYGPYKTGDIATVPKDNGMLIVEKGAGEVVEAS